MTWEAWYEGSYDGPHNTRLVINADGTFSIGTVESRGLRGGGILCRGDFRRGDGVLCFRFP